MVCSITLVPSDEFRDTYTFTVRVWEVFVKWFDFADGFRDKSFEFGDESKLFESSADKRKTQRVKFVVQFAAHLLGRLVRQFAELVEW